MSPTLRHGDLVLVLPLPVGCGPRVGDVVLAGDPREPSRETLKRVAALPGGAADLAGLPGIVPAGSVALAGDDRTASTDSRHYGAVSDRLLRGRVALRIWPDPGRIGTAPATRAPLT